MDISRELLGRLIRANYPRRTIIGDNISKASSQDVVCRLRELDNESAEPIVIEFNSNGGVYHEGASLIVRNLKLLRSPTVGVVFSRCYSSAMSVLQGCTLRVSLREARFLLHNNNSLLKLTPNLNPGEMAEFVVNTIAELRRNRDSVVKALHERLSHLSHGEIVDIMDEDRPFGAERALSLGIIDRIIEDDG